MKTKKEVKAKIQVILFELPINISLKNNYNNEYNLLLELFKQHPDADEKIKNLNDIVIQPNKLYNTRGFVIINHDKTETTISYNECITPTKNRSKTELKEAMRYSIYKDTIEFKSTAKLECEFCLSRCNLETDHILEFKNISRAFLLGRQDIPITFDKSIANQRCFKLQDNQFENEWYNYHKEHAKYRRLCRKCNVGRNKIEK